MSKFSCALITNLFLTSALLTACDPRARFDFTGTASPELSPQSEEPPANPPTEILEVPDPENPPVDGGTPEVPPPDNNTACNIPEEERIPLSDACPDYARQGHKICICHKKVSHPISPDEQGVFNGHIHHKEDYFAHCSAPSAPAQ